ANRKVFQRIAVQTVDGEQRELLLCALLVSDELLLQPRCSVRRQHASGVGHVTLRLRYLARERASRREQREHCDQLRESLQDSRGPSDGASHVGRRPQSLISGALSEPGAAWNVGLTLRPRIDAPMLVGKRCTMPL